MGREWKQPWVTKVTQEKKDWGSEAKWSSSASSYSKIIWLYKNHRTSLKKYQIKSESFYLVSGLLQVLYGDEGCSNKELMTKVVLKPGEVLSVPSGCPYSLMALEDSVIIETADRDNGICEIIEKGGVEK